MLSIGLVGLPNTGKSTLFQAITQKQVDRANYPFCTIEPNLGVVAVPDERLDRLAEMFPRNKKIPAAIEFVDIAGLIAGASQGEGLGNKFLAHIREVDALVYVLRGFLKESIVNAFGSVDPWGEKEVLDAELSLKDLETIEKRICSLEKQTKSGDAEAVKELASLNVFARHLKEGRLLFDVLDKDERMVAERYQLLTAKPRLYLINADSKEVTEEIKEKFKNDVWIALDVLTELEAAQLTESECLELGLDQKGLDRLIASCYRLLDLISFFTVGRDEVRAWALARGRTAPEAGGVVHTDFQEKFIKAEVINWRDLVEAGDFAGARQKGLIRTEGRDYRVEDGDVIEIKFGA